MAEARGRGRGPRGGLRRQHRAAQLPGPDAAALATDARLSDGPVRHRLLVSCADRAGIVAAVSSFLAGHGANITSSDQHSTDPSGGRFLMRMEYVLEGGDAVSLERAFGREVGAPFAMDWRISPSRPRKRVAVLVSREDHCLLDLLWRWRRGELDGEIALVASNHEVCRDDAEGFGVPFAPVPAKAEAQLLSELAAADVQLVVLARYMQILSGDFLERVGCPVINIHHSFLPAFVGADPYRRALERGVKIIGATAHYVTEELDAGPIIDQDVERVDHRHDIEGLEEVGRDIERRVLARAVQRHLEDRVLVLENRTVV
ncbi:MAG TPA: formyltetrahydrofolate deformylase [Thermoleophilaceae bacterium]|nr:formyltetrahydrofolate deformylase [Thermoleophilaceae bacterium]